MTGLLGGLLDPVLNPIGTLLNPDPTNAAQMEASRVFYLLKWGPFDGPKMFAQATK